MHPARPPYPFSPIPILSPPCPPSHGHVVGPPSSPLPIRGHSRALSRARTPHSLPLELLYEFARRTKLVSLFFDRDRTVRLRTSTGASELCCSYKLAESLLPCPAAQPCSQNPPKPTLPKAPNSTSETLAMAIRARARARARRVRAASAPLAVSLVPVVVAYHAQDGVWLISAVGRRQPPAASTAASAPARATSHAAQPLLAPPASSP